MLEYIRSRAQGAIAWIIVILITIPFALWGIQEYTGGGTEPPVAQVNDSEISKRQLELAYMRQRQQLQQMLGENFKPEMFPERPMKRRLLQQLIQRELLLQAAYSAQMRVGDRQLADVVRSIPAFQDDSGAFSREQYERVVRMQGMSIGQFESQLRRDLLVDQFRQGVIETAFVTEPELDRYLSLEQQTRDAGYFLVPVERYRDSVELEEGEVAEFYESNPERYSVPEKVKIAYLDLSVEELAKGVEVADDELRAYYESRIENYRKPEERKASHILISVPEDAAEAQIEAARSEAQQVLEAIRDGADFAAMAKEHSDDPVSAQAGGDLGFFGRERMVEAFSDKAFAMEAGEISDPVRTQYGFHIIRLDAIRGGKAEPFEAVRDEIARELRREKATDLFYDKAEQLANLTYEHPESLQVAAEEVGLEIQQSGFFSRDGGSGLAGNRAVVEAAFHPEVLEEGLNSQPVDLSKTRTVVLRVIDRQPQHRKPLEEVRAQIVEALTARKAREQAREAAEEALASVRAGQSPEAVASGLGVEWKRDTVSREADGLDPDIRRWIFSMPRPEQGGVSLERIAVADGDQAVLVLFGVENGPGLSAETDNLEQTRRGLSGDWGEAGLNSVIDQIRRGADIETNEKRL